MAEKLTSDKSRRQFQGRVAVMGPGAILKEARIGMNLERRVVAKRMRLGLRVIEAIEHDDYSKMPPLTFVKGYLRSYAKLVGLLPETVIVAFDAVHPIKKISYQEQVFKKSSCIFAKPLALKPRRDGMRKVVRWITLIMILGALVLLGMWLKNRHALFQGSRSITQPGMSVSVSHTNENENEAEDEEGVTSTERSPFETGQKAALPAPVEVPADTNESN